jgi:GT2 family glycosyltransferase
MRVAVVIAAHKMFPKLEPCLQGFVSLLPDPNDLVFVDNSSDENLYEWVQRQFPEITAIRLTQNRYFCGGYNAGIRVAMEKGYDFVLIVNADTEVVNRGFLSELLKTAQRWPRAAFIGPLVYFRSPEVVQKTCLQFPSIIRSASIWFPWRIFPNHFQKQPGKETIVELLNGVCVLCRIRALEEFGLMDENMGGYAEDYDWSWRAREKGWVSVFTPVPSVVHHESPSGYESYSLKTFLEKRNTVYWFLKIGRHYSAWIYAKASTVLATARLLEVRSADEREKHRHFLQRLIRAFNGLLRREPLGEWFGPPLGLWDGHV